MPDEAADEIETCGRCDLKHERAGHRTCNGHTRREGELKPCYKYPVGGAAVCRTHGAGAPQVQRRAAERLVDQAVSNILDLANIDQRHRDKSPDEQLLDEVARSAQAVEWLAQQVAQLHWPDATDTGELPWVVGIDPGTGDLVEVPHRARLMAPDHNNELKPHPFWDKLDQERDRHARLARWAIEAGISERLVRLAETQAQMMVSVVLHVIDALQLSPQQAIVAKKAAADKMRGLGPGTLNVDSRPKAP